MVARIKRTSSLSRSLNYNEKKVQAGVAGCIHAVNYPKDLEKLNFYDKLHRLEHQAALNERIKANSVHISLNFSENDALTKEKLCAIAESYMKGIGFEKQPYLVYQHRDAGHPHIHIVSTHIQKDGSKIEMNNIGRNQSEVARKTIEQKFGLTVAEGRSKKPEQVQEDQLKVGTQKVQYGKTATKQAITNVLDAVINQYRYTSLPELNAILKLYNVMADRGKEDTKMYQKGGLVYTALDNQGAKVGTPIKASAFYSKPTLKYLEQKFVQNESLRQVHQQRLKTAIKWVLVKEKQSIADFTKALAKEGVQVVLRQNAQGTIYGLTYVDFKTKCVFNGSDLGKEFSAKAILEKCTVVHEQANTSSLKQSKEQDYGNAGSKQSAVTLGKGNSQNQEQRPEGDNKQDTNRALEDLLNPNKPDNYLPYQLLQKKKKKKSRGLHL